MTDGLSNTLMIVEAGEAVPWYKPDVLAYDGKLPLPQLGAKDADRFLAVMGDGSVREFRPSKLGEKSLRALITINGGEVVEIDSPQALANAAEYERNRDVYQRAGVGPAEFVHSEPVAIN